MRYSERFVRLIGGSAIFAFGTVIILNSNIGYGPWDVFHAGLALRTGLTIGTASIITGLTLTFLVFLLKEAIGLATIVSLLVIGKMIDVFRALPWPPVCHNFWLGIPYMILGIFFSALGTYFYLSAALGTGPRDGLMVAARRHLHFQVGPIRITMELTAALVGWLLGGSVGLGTLLYAFGFGIVLQFVFRLFHFETTAVAHDNLPDSYRKLKLWLKRLPSGK